MATSKRGNPGRAPGRGGAGALSVEALVGSALALADAEGLDALTVRRMAAEHGVTPMAMYHYFADKDALLGALSERLLSQVRLDDAGGSWDARLQAFFASFLAVLRPHPEVAALVRTRILDGPAGLAVAEHVLGLLTAAGLDAEQAAEVGTYALSALVTLVTAAPGPPAATADRAGQVRRRRARLSALDPARFPHVIAAAEPLADCRDEDVYFDRGLALLLGGIRALPGSGTGQL
jgi:AcrR family transcriptional regulator